MFEAPPDLLYVSCAIKVLARDKKDEKEDESAKAKAAMSVDDSIFEWHWAFLLSLLLLPFS